MLETKIAEFKSKLSYYLKRARLGEDIVVFDRETPIVRIVSFESKKDPLKIISAKKNPNEYKKFKIKSVPMKVDLLEILRQDRDGRF